MKGIFGKSSKNPAEIVRNLKDDLNTLEKGGDGKKQDKVTTMLAPASAGGGDVADSPSSPSSIWDFSSLRRRKSLVRSCPEVKHDACTRKAAAAAAAR
jgi:hypothetical protein